MFSAELPWCYFCAEKKVLGLGWKFTENIFGVYKNYWRKELLEGGPPRSHELRGRALPPRTCPVSSWVPQTSVCPNSNSIKTVSSRKKSERNFHQVLWYGATATSCSSSGGLIWNPFGAPERGIRRRRHHQPSSIDNSMMLTTGSE
jgi:hypothetical protein